MLDLALIRFHSVDGGIERHGQLNILADQAVNHLAHVGDDGIQVQDAGLEHLLAAESQQLARECRRALSSLPDLFGVLAQLIAVEWLSLQLVGVADDHAQ